MENFRSPSSPKKQPTSIAARLNCWNCLSFRIAHTESPTYPLQCLNCEAKGTCTEFLGNPINAAIVNRRGRRIA
jgi:hypothetical protein